MRKHEMVLKSAQSSSDGDTLRSQAWKSEAAPGGAKASVNMAAQQQPGTDLKETAGSGRTLSQPPSGKAALSAAALPSRSAPPRLGRPGPRAR